FGGHNPFESFFGGGRSGGGRRANRGSNLRIKIKLTLEEIVKGVEKTIKVNKLISCAVCSGTGAKNGGAYRTCPTCHGAGSVRRVTNTILGQMQPTSTCPTCHGEGQVITDKCTACDGERVTRGGQTSTISSPAGVSGGMQLSGRG